MKPFIATRGGMSLREAARMAVRREYEEEINVDVGKFEISGNIGKTYTPSMELYHEIAMVYDGAFDRCMQAGFSREANGDEIRAIWKGLDEFELGKSILYPTGLLELLQIKCNN